MTELQSWAMGFCTAGVGCSLLEMLCPQGTMKRAFSLLTALFMFCGLLSPVQSLLRLSADWFAQLSEETAVSEAVTQKAEEQMEAVLEAELLRDAEERLSTYGVTVKKVELVRDMTRTDSIYIERVKVMFAKEDHPLPAEMPAVLECAWGVIVEVYYVE